MTCYVMDACAMLALIRDEEGADMVADILNAANCNKAKIIMHKANLLEVYYDLLRTFGKEKADAVIIEIKKRPIEINPEITDEIFTEAGRLKARHRISFADSFALAQTKVSGGTLLTSDHHEFDEIEQKEAISIAWIR
ncbi:MAG: type II toxin-antitoxin system VapC family toxin [Defluviitaleaceae bacterium]|nr:type II toxin-antitoxin system VapC family toxin [Defluviitaleaceae bacterium]MCL2240113.1 type II toxin-antitoxin system VapC family toxin [Defluviitaleaceae bacterium]